MNNNGRGEEMNNYTTQTARYMITITASNALKYRDSAKYLFDLVQIIVIVFVISFLGIVLVAFLRIVLLLLLGIPHVGHVGGIGLVHSVVILHIVTGARHKLLLLALLIVGWIVCIVPSIIVVAIIHVVHLSPTNSYNDAI